MGFHIEPPVAERPAAIISVTPMEEPPRFPKRFSLSGEIPAFALVGGIVAVALGTLGNIWLGGRYVERLETRIGAIEIELERNRTWRDRQDETRSEIQTSLGVITAKLDMTNKDRDRTEAQLAAILNRLPIK